MESKKQKDQHGGHIKQWQYTGNWGQYSGKMKAIRGYIVPILGQ